ncbi:MAG: hypothetical protein AVDCRST_MAG90-2100, partial [uncultured Microvirga sp.]
EKSRSSGRRGGVAVPRRRLRQVRKLQHQWPVEQGLHRYQAAAV